MNVNRRNAKTCIYTEKTSIRVITSIQILIIIVTPSVDIEIIITSQRVLYVRIL